MIASLVHEGLVAAKRESMKADGKTIEVVRSGSPTPAARRSKSDAQRESLTAHCPETAPLRNPLRPRRQLIEAC